MELENNHCIKNSIDFITKVKLEPNYKIISFDIVNLYTIISIQDTMDIEENDLSEVNKLSYILITELIYLLKVVFRQNYLKFDVIISYKKMDHGFTFICLLESL